MYGVQSIGYGVVWVIGGREGYGVKDIGYEGMVYREGYGVKGIGYEVMV